MAEENGAHMPETDIKLDSRVTISARLVQALSDYISKSEPVQLLRAMQQDVKLLEEPDAGEGKE